MKKQLLYFVDHSYPHSSDGYAVRTHAVAQGFVQNGYRVTVVNRLGRIFSVPGIDAKAVKPRYQIDGINYLFFKAEQGQSTLSKNFDQWITGATAAVKGLLESYQPDLVIAASNWENAWPVKQACQALGYSFTYEVRGFWELSRATKDPGWAKNPEFDKIKAREADVANAAERVVTLNKLMKEELISRGVDGKRIELLPNSLSALPEAAQGELRNQQSQRVKKQYGVKQQYVVGYIGTFNAYEGLPLIVEALRHLPKKVAVLLVGGTVAHGHDSNNKSDIIRDELLQLAETLDVSDRLYFTGRVAPDEVTQLYSAIDVIVNARLSTPVTDIVSALKLVETAAHATPMVLSDIGANRDINNDFSCPVPLFKAGDADDLAQQLENVLNNWNEYRQQAERNRDFVAQQRLFPTLINMLF